MPDKEAGHPFSAQSKPLKKAGTPHTPSPEKDSHQVSDLVADLLYYLLTTKLIDFRKPAPRLMVAVYAPLFQPDNGRFC